jgi:hypothetical protein
MKSFAAITSILLGTSYPTEVIKDLYMGFNWNLTIVDEMTHENKSYDVNNKVALQAANITCIAGETQYDYSTMIHRKFVGCKIGDTLTGFSTFCHRKQQPINLSVVTISDRTHSYVVALKCEQR